MIELVEASGRRHRLVGAGPWIVGRNPACDAVFADDPACSRRHFELRWKRAATGVLVVTPISTTSPTTVDGVVIEDETDAHHGSRIAFGGSSVSIYADRAASDGSMTIPVDAAAHGVCDLVMPAGKSQAVIGRDKSVADLVVDHPSVSRRHAALSRDASGALSLRDLGSTNGTFVNGRRVVGQTTLRPDDSITIGARFFRLTAGGLNRQSSSSPVCIHARGVAIDVRGTDGGPKRILQPTDVDIARGELVCIIGGSGAGKSTLMGALAGRSEIAEGSITIDGHDVAREFETLKQFVAYLPQREALHERLTVRQALEFVAQLRLPADTPAEQRASRIEQSVADVELAAQIDTAFHALSGGQKKRACLAAEILCEPEVLFLDEVTSGLDEHTDYEMMQLLHRLSRSGTTIVCVTHTLVNIPRYCDRVIIMAPGGRLAFAGPPAAALAHFGISNLGEVFAKLGGSGGKIWAERFAREHRGLNPQVASRGRRRTAGAPSPVAVLARAVSQYVVLCRRNVVLLLADPRTLALAFLQAAVIGIAVGWALEDFGSGALEVASQKIMLTLMAIAAVWIGCSGSSKDIIGEADILQRERDVNLMAAPYLLSRVTVATGFMALQVGLMIACLLLLADSIPGDDLLQIGLTLAMGAIGVVLGLLISACSSSTSQATTIVPLVLIPQLVFVGTLVPNISSFLDDLTSTGVPSNVMTEAMLGVLVESGERVLELDLETGQAVELAVRDAVDSAALGALHYVVILLAAFAVLLVRYRTGTR